MWTGRRTVWVINGALMLSALPAIMAQKGGGGSGGQQASGGSGAQGATGGGGSLPGLSYADHDWPALLKTPPVNKSRVVLCYKLKYGNSNSQPFILQPIPGAARDGKPSMPIKCGLTGDATKDIKDDEERRQCKANQSREDPAVNGHWNACSVLDVDHPIQMRDLLVIGIDASEIKRDDRRLRLLNINVTSQQGNPLNATPVRPSFSASASASQNAGADNVFFLTWPFELPGDVVPTVSVNTVYTPPPPGAPWRPNTFYPAGSVVTSVYGNGHYYTAIKGGLSGDSDEPAFPMDAVPRIQDGDIAWLDSGTTLPTGAKASAWLPNHYYCLGDAILDPYNGHYYTEFDGNPPPTTGPCVQSAPPASPLKLSGPIPTDPFPVRPPELLPQQSFRVYDGSAIWELQPRVTVGSHWSADIEYPAGSRVTDAAGRHEYWTRAGGRSGAVPDQPFFPISQTATIREPGSGLSAVLEDLAKSANDPEYQEKLKRYYGDVPQEQYDRITKAVPEWSAQAPTKLRALVGGEAATTAQQIDPVTWMDAGTATPVIVAAGQPADQTVNLLNLTLPQVHSMYYYNLAAGAIVSTVRTPNLATVPLGGCDQTGCNYAFEKQGSNLLVDPVLLLTWYPRPFDAERPYRLSDLKHVGASFGLSLASPASNFYIGASAEVRRNIQLVMGFNIAKISKLSVSGAETTVHVTGSAPSPPTAQYFARGGFVGLTFNVSGFLQGLFGGGGGGAGGGASGGKPSGQ